MSTEPSVLVTEVHRAKLQLVQALTLLVNLCCDQPEDVEAPPQPPARVLNLLDLELGPDGRCHSVELLQGSTGHHKGVSDDAPTLDRQLDTVVFTWP